MLKYRIIPLLITVLLTIVSCSKPDNPAPSPTPTPTPTPTPIPSVQKDIVVPSASQSYFSNGVSLSSGITDPAAASGTVQSQTVTFTAPAAWTATVTATKAVDWLTVDPSSGSAGDVSMKVTAQANTGYEERAATVTIKSGDANKSFVVKQSGKPRPVEVSGIVLDRTELSMTVGDAVTLVATVSPENATDKSVSWSSSDTNVATVDVSGKVTAVSAGSATVTAKAGEKTASCSVTVSAAQVTPTPTPTPAPDPDPTPTPQPPAPEPPADVLVSSVTLNTTTLSLTEGDTITLTATVGPSNATDRTVTWTSSDTKVATVDENGKVTAVAAGSATIMAKAGDQTSTCSVVVSAKVVPVTSVSLDQTSLALTEEDSVTLTVTVGPENATDKTVTWSSSDTNVATVDQTGRVTAVKAGAAIITAKAGDKTASCTVTVTRGVPPGGSEGIGEEVWK